MLNKYILIAFTLTIIISSVVSVGLRPEKLCLITEKIYREVQCRQYQCDVDICAANGDICESFLAWKRITNAHKPVDYVYNNQQTYNQFIKSIRHCSKNQYVPLEREACLNKKMCTEKKKWTSRLMFKGVDIVEKKKCLCEGQYGFECHKDYCTLNKNTCERLFDQRKTDMHVIRKIKACR